MHTGKGVAAARLPEATWARDRAGSAGLTVCRAMAPQPPGDERHERAATAVVYCEANFGAIDGKTGNGLVRHSEKYEILSVIDRPLLAAPFVRRRPAAPHQHVTSEALELFRS